MNLENIVAVTGLSGLYKLVATRSNGLIIEDFDSGKRTFISMRKHQFTPVESIGIYTYGDVVDIEDVFKKVDTSADKPEPNAPGHELHKYFRTVLPDYDESRVHLSDIKKLLKWYSFLNERGLLSDTASDEEE